MVRVYRNGQSDDEPSTLKSPLVTGFIKFELIAGAFFLMIGGFVLRAEGNYVLIVVGTTFFLLGLFRMWQRAQLESESARIEDDRILRVLRHRLSANYSLVLDYQLPGDDTIPYLILGPPGVIILQTWSTKGEVKEDTSGRKWIVTREDGPSESLLNPVVENERLEQKLRDTVDKPGLLRPLEHYVVLVGRRAESPPLKNDHVIEMNELVGKVRVEDNEDGPLNWEDVDDLERMLDLK